MATRNNTKEGLRDDTGDKKNSKVKNVITIVLLLVVIVGFVVFAFLYLNNGGNITSQGSSESTITRTEDPRATPGNADDSGSGSGQSGGTGGSSGVGDSGDGARPGHSDDRDGHDDHEGHDGHDDHEGHEHRPGEPHHNHGGPWDPATANPKDIAQWSTMTGFTLSPQNRTWADAENDMIEQYGTPELKKRGRTVWEPDGGHTLSWELMQTDKNSALYSYSTVDSVEKIDANTYKYNLNLRQRMTIKNGDSNLPDAKAFIIMKRIDGKWLMDDYGYTVIPSVW